MARLIALVLLRWRTSTRAIVHSPGSLLGLLAAVPGLLIFSAFASIFAYAGVRTLESARPEALLPLLSAAATAVGLFWAFSPLLAGVALSETHDVTRLLHFPIPLPILVCSSLVANLAEPAVLAQAPLILSLALATGGLTLRFPLALFGILIAFALILAASQIVGLSLHGLARNRRFHDVALSLGLVFGFLLSLLPVVLLSGGGRPAGRAFRALLETDVLAFSPFAWGVRAAVHAGRGELVPFALHAAAGVLALALAAGASSLLLSRIHRGDVILRAGAPELGGAARMVFAGSLAALVEKDLRVAWRDPALKTVLAMGLLSPLLFLFFLSTTDINVRSERTLLLLATLIGISIGNNALGHERRGIALLVGFPVARWRILVAKNLAATIFRLPGFLMLMAVCLTLARPAAVPAIATVALLTLMISSGVDNYLSILVPMPAPAAGRNPYSGAAAGGRGLGAAALAAVMLPAALVLMSPFLFLAWLPVLLGNRGLWVLSLPLALAGALAVYAMLVAGAASLFARREPEILARILGEE